MGLDESFVRLKEEEIRLDSLVDRVNGLLSVVDQASRMSSERTLECFRMSGRENP